MCCQSELENVYTCGVDVALELYKCVAKPWSEILGRAWIRLLPTSCYALVLCRSSVSSRQYVLRASEGDNKQGKTFCHCPYVHVTDYIAYDTLPNVHPLYCCSTPTYRYELSIDLYVICEAVGHPQSLSQLPSQYLLIDTVTNDFIKLSALRSLDLP